MVCGTHTLPLLSKNSLGALISLSSMWQHWFSLVFWFFFWRIGLHLWEAGSFPASIVLQSIENYRFQPRATCVCKYSHSLSLAQIDRLLLFLKLKQKRGCGCHSVLSVSKFLWQKTFICLLIMHDVQFQFTIYKKCLHCKSKLIFNFSKFFFLS